MRITRETLLKLAKETVNRRVQQDRGIVAVYLVGSLLGSEPLLGGTADVDLVFVHDTDPFLEREFIALNDEALLDIQHLSQVLFRHPRDLRVDPWLGSDLYASPLVLHDTQHWFDFTQASARSQFTHPENVLARARKLADSARQEWSRLSLLPPEENGPALVYAYLKILEQAANAVACLSGGPLSGRRFLLRFPERAQSVGRPELSAGLVSLLGGGLVPPEDVRAWLPDWAVAYDRAARQNDAPLELHSARKLYIQHGVEALLEGEQPEAALWALLRSWALSARSLPAGSPCLKAWGEASARLRLAHEDRPERLGSLDRYLDQVEETLDRWGQENGA